jgi:hypothetical protein
LTDDGRVCSAPPLAPPLDAGGRGAIDVARRGAWLSCLAAALQILARNSEGTGQGSGENGNRSNFQIVGFGRKNRDALLRWARTMFGVTAGAVEQRGRKGVSKKK